MSGRRQWDYLIVDILATDVPVWGDSGPTSRNYEMRRADTVDEVLVVLAEAGALGWEMTARQSINSAFSRYFFKRPRE